MALEGEAEHTDIGLGATESQEERDRLKSDKEEAESKLDKVEEQIEALNEDIRIYEGTLESTWNYLQPTFKEALSQADLLDAPDHDTKSTTSSADQASYLDGYATTLFDEEGQEPDSEELLRQATPDNAYQKHFAFRPALAKFDDRQADYQREVEAFHRLKGEGRVIYSCTKFDNNEFFHVS